MLKYDPMLQATLYREYEKPSYDAAAADAETQPSTETIPF
jgi:hypothetical protein